MSNDFSPLPVRVFPAEGESGLGFVLRASSRNGVPMKTLLKSAGASKSRWIKPTAIPVLARITEVASEWLRHHFIIARPDNGHQLSEWHGALWSFPLSLRGMRAQYCGACLRQFGRCHAAWELGAAFVCLEHRAMLRDRCPHCGRIVSWARPAIDVCACGRYLTAQSPQPEAAAWQLQWTATVLAGTTDIPCSQMQGSELPPCLQSLSPDGLLAVVFAFGVRESAGANVSGTEAVVSPAPDVTACIVERGLRRLRSLRPFETSCPPALRDVVYVEGLERLARRGASDADRAIAVSLRDWLRGVPKAGYSTVGRRVRGQLDLFR